VGVSNSGKITTLTNGGAISGGNGGNATRTGGAGGAGVSNAGTMTSLTNSGAISGGNGGNGGATMGAGGAGGAGVENSGAIKTLTNSGTISGGNGGSGHTGGAGGTGLANTGTIATLTNTGTITNGDGAADAIYSAGSQASIGLLSNSGQIDGAVDLLGGSGDTLDNFGLISGNIALAGGDILMNQGQVYGDVMLAGGDTLIDTGLIHGDVTLGSADSFDASQGGVGGTIGAASGDLFEFGGYFGAETIDNFTAGAGLTHDTLEFSTSDFDNYAAPKNAMSQAGFRPHDQARRDGFDHAQPRQFVEPRLRGLQVRVGRGARDLLATARPALTAAPAYRIPRRLRR
jgi:hypothetical protein